MQSMAATYHQKTSHINFNTDASASNAERRNQPEETWWWSQHLKCVSMVRCRNQWPLCCQIVLTKPRSHHCHVPSNPWTFFLVGVLDGVSCGKFLCMISRFLSLIGREIQNYNTQTPKLKNGNSFHSQNFRIRWTAWKSFSRTSNWWEQTCDFQTCSKFPLKSIFSLQDLRQSHRPDPVPICIVVQCVAHSNVAEKHSVCHKLWSIWWLLVQICLTTIQYLVCCQCVPHANIWWHFKILWTILQQIPLLLWIDGHQRVVLRFWISGPFRNRSCKIVHWPYKIRSSKTCQKNISEHYENILWTILLQISILPLFSNAHRGME